MVDNLEQSKELIIKFGKTEKDTGKRIPILQDLSGPKIRIGNFNDEVVTLEEGNTFTLTFFPILICALRSLIT